MSTTLSQTLHTRHINMIAMGGAIGTSIFLASGYAIYVGGPGGALLAYLLIAVVVYFLMTSLGEMSTYKPSSGTFCEYSSLYVGRDFGFAMSYNYWLSWAITIAVELVAVSLIMGYWFPSVNGAVFPIIFFFAMLLSNIFLVRVYGEIEYCLSFIKVAAIIAFIVVGIFAIFYQPHFGAQRWFLGDAPFHHGYLGFITVFLFAGFSFQGTELIGVASGETKDPQTAIPRSIRMIFWRLTLFYILTLGIISLLIPYDDPRLAYQDKLSMSPYTLVFSQYLPHYAADMMNFIILVAVLSAGNASMYCASRILWYVGKKGEAPLIFGKITPQGVPLFALLATALVGSLGFISSVVHKGVLFSYLLQISSLSGFIAWFGIALSHYQFRKKYLPQHGGIDVLKYKARFYPYAQIIAMLVIGFVVIAQFVPLLESPEQSIGSFLIVYSSVILFLILYLASKCYYFIKS